jgi:hypothetical protein
MSVHLQPVAAALMIIAGWVAVRAQPPQEVQSSGTKPCDKWNRTLRMIPRAAARPIRETTSNTAPHSDRLASRNAGSGAGRDWPTDRHQAFHSRS